MQRLFLYAGIIFYVVPAIAQSGFEPVSVKKRDESKQYKTEAMRYYWAHPEASSQNTYKISGVSDVDFTCYGIGILPSEPLNYDEMKLEVKAGDEAWKAVDADFTPDRIPRDDLYWTDLNFTNDGYPTRQISLRIRLPEGISLDSVKLQVFSMDFHSNKSKGEDPRGEPKTQKTGDCPEYPDVVPRSVWLDPYYTQPAYTPAIIYPHHVVIHHGASPDIYDDGAEIVRSYWNYHVNTLGWSDIGYNYLTDKYGNIYKGRMNSDPLNQDCRGAHAGASNDESIGVNFLGNSDVTYPTNIQLDVVYQFLGWWFNKRGYDPTESADIVLQSGGTGSIPRICGHRDVNINGTECPGDTLYALLPQIRTMTAARIQACEYEPHTEIAVAGNWQTEDFTAAFTDVDSSGFGIQSGFWQVLDFNGDVWDANLNRGHFNDNFQTAMHPEWINITGTWEINNEHLYQSDESEGNTNLYIPLRQRDTTAYLYHWQMNIDGTGDNRRAGIHVFCDSAEQSNRHNSYMVYYRVDQNTVQLYKYTDNTYSLQTDDYAGINAGEWYDCKLYYNPSTGDLKAWLNGTLVSEWTDDDPYSEGRHVSLRTGNAQVMYDDVKVYTARNETEMVTIGNEDAHVWHQNPYPDTSSCRIKSLLLDSLDNYSAVAGLDVNIDWTAPDAVDVRDGAGADQDTIYGLEQFPVNWDAPADVHSGINTVEISLGTEPELADVQDWTPVSSGNDFVFTDVDLILDSTYYAGLRITNHAGLDFVVYSDGALARHIAVADLLYGETDLCVDDSLVFYNLSEYEDSVTWYFENGSPEFSSQDTVYVQWPESGDYTVSLTAWYNGNMTDTSLNVNLQLHGHPSPDFHALSTDVELPDAFVAFVNESEHATGFYWDFGDDNFSEQAEPWHVYDTTGVYSVMLVAANDYCATDTMLKEDYIVVQEENAIGGITSAGISIYPNPANETLFVDLSESSYHITGVLVVDMQGKRLIEKPVNGFYSGRLSIDLGALPSGTYFIGLKTDDNTLWQRFEIMDK